MMKLLAWRTLPLVFVAVLVAWGGRELAGRGSNGVVARASAEGYLAPTIAVTSTTSTAATGGVAYAVAETVATESPAVAAATETVEAVAPEATALPPVVRQAVVAPRPAPTATATPAPTVERISAEEETRRFAALQALAKSASAYLLAGDEGAVRAQLTTKCAGMDVVGLVANRRATIERDAGQPLDQLKAAQPVIAHFDTQQGDAHLIFQFSGTKLVSILIAEGYVWEGAAWRYAPCL